VNRVSAEGLFLPYYGYATALAVDPIEKKPLYHFRPGSRILSLGFAGCNLRCPFCQNWQISQLGDSAPEGRKLRPEDAVALVMEDASGPPLSGSSAAEPPPFGFSAGPFSAGQIAYTYSEPLIHFEFLKDCMELAHERGIANVLVSNGCVNLETAEKILPLTDAANIDLKCFSEKTYREVLGGDLETVLNFIRAARACGVWLELSTLVVPGLNDDEAEIDRCAEFTAALEAEPFGGGAAAAPGGETLQSKAAAAPGPAAFGERPVPWHLSACHPAYRWNGPPTRAADLLRLAERARKVLPFVYAGNIPGEENNTSCPRCGAVLIRRGGGRVDAGLLAAPCGQISAGGAESRPPSSRGPAEHAAEGMRGGPPPPAGENPAFRGLRPCRCSLCGAELPVYW
jgi:pyruvate formate lyase activating enzyme